VTTTTTVELSLRGSDFRDSQILSSLLPEALSSEYSNSHHASPQIRRPHNCSSFTTHKTLGLSPTTSNLMICKLLNLVATCSHVINGWDLVATSDFEIYLHQVYDFSNYEILKYFIAILCVALSYLTV
jgi:hypothetical protein